MEKAIMLQISGYARCGKDTAADLIIESVNKYSNYKAKKFNFAKYVKIKTAEKYNIPLEHLFDDKIKTVYRKEMISVGDIERDNNPYIWCEMIINDFNIFIEECKAINKTPIILIADNRYFNEINYFKNTNKYDKIGSIDTLHIICNEKVWKQRLRDGYLDHLELRKNRSERDINQFNYDFDYVISNNSSKECFSNILSSIIGDIINNYEYIKW